MQLQTHSMARGRMLLTVSLSLAGILLVYRKVSTYGKKWEDGNNATEMVGELLHSSGQRNGYSDSLHGRRKEWENLVSSLSQKRKSHRVPDVIGIGVRKCGTGMLQHFMRQHPLVGVGSNEIHYYDKDIDKGLEFYKRVLPSATSEQLIMEKTPAYFTSLPADLPRIIKGDTPFVKIILLLCDPVTRAFSDYVMRDNRLSKKSLDMTFEEYVSEYFEPVKVMFRNLSMHDDEYAVAEVIRKLKITKRAYSFAYGVYAYFIRRWVEVFAPKHLMVIDGEQFLRDPGSVLERVQNYLEIPVLLRKEDFVRHPESGLYCLRRWWNVSYNFDEESRNPNSWDRFLECGAEGKGRTRSQNSKYTLKPETARKLREFFKPYNEVLFSILNERFDWH